MKIKYRIVNVYVFDAKRYQAQKRFLYIFWIDLGLTHRSQSEAEERIQRDASLKPKKEYNIVYFNEKAEQIYD